MLVPASTLTFTTIALATPDSGGNFSTTTQWSTSFFSPGVRTSLAQPATGTISLTGNPADTNTVTVSDGVKIVTFEFDDNATITAGNVTVTIGASAALTMTALLAAIAASGLRLSWTAGVTTTTNTLFTSTASNVFAVPTWTKSGANITVAGLTVAGAQRFRSWIELWVENGTDADLDFACLSEATSNAAAVILAATKTPLLLKLPPGQRFVWEFKRPVPGPIYVRGSTADPTVGNLRYGEFAE